MTRPNAPVSRVPVEHRLLGLDRRTVPFAVVALAVWLLWAVVVPAIDGAIPWDDPVRPGDVIRLSDTVTLTPTVGWALEDGLRTTDTTASGATSTGGVLLSRDGVRFEVQTGPFAGEPAALLGQINRITTTVAGPASFQLTGGATTIVAATGEPGVLETFSSPRVDGVLATFVFDGTGFQVQAVGPPDQMTAHARDVRDMIASIGRAGGAR